MFIPIGDDNRKRERFPFIVWTIFACNCFVWFLQQMGHGAFTYAFSTVPYEITTGIDLAGPVSIGSGRYAVEVPHAPGPSPIYLTLLTAMFMHGSWMHIIGNMIYLLIFGDQIEDLLGHVRFAIFYVVCGVMAGLAQVWAAPESIIPCLGASGAIAGVLGAYLIKHPTNAVHVLLLFRMVVTLPAWVVLGGWILLQLLSQTTVGTAKSGVAYMAHIGGFVAGLLLVFLFAIGTRARRRGKDDSR